MNTFEKYGISIPEILIPKNIDTSTWSVVACDQYTQDRNYWKDVEKTAGTKPSALNIILPEVYLQDSDKSERIKKIKSVMRQYISDGVFSEPEKSFVYIERTTGFGRVRHGLVVALDLETYDWKPFTTALTRATEATILERIPPRMEIRNGAPLESPHIMLLVNDPDHALVEKTGELAKKDAPLYEGDLMKNGGSIKGWAVKSYEAVMQVTAGLEKLYNSGKATVQGKETSFLFAVGDGNHSLATAKTVWNEYKQKLLAEGKSDEEISESPVRYALVEIVNIYDTGLTFEPIHRVLFNADGKAVLDFVQKNLGGNIVKLESEKLLAEKVRNSKAGFGFIYKSNVEMNYIFLDTPVTDLAVSALQPCLDKFIASENAAGNKEKIEIDYIHGEDEVMRLGSNGALGLLLPPVAKDSFFATISGRGPLPRKSFSMGEADEKRFYLECRKLFD